MKNLHAQWNFTIYKMSALFNVLFSQGATVKREDPDHDDGDEACTTRTENTVPGGGGDSSRGHQQQQDPPLHQSSQLQKIRLPTGKCKNAFQRTT